jgi:arylsulfatase A-like enzyme
MRRHESGDPTNLYDGGTWQPLAVWWPGRVKAGQVCDDFINLMDLAPTFLEAAGLKPPPEMTGRSFLGLLTGQEKPGSRGTVFLERERHANVRAGDVGYPMRAIRTPDYLDIRNLRSARWPAGDPQAHKDPYRPFGDCDDGPTKNCLLEHREEPAMRGYFELCFGKRPAEELYDLNKDPHQLRNLAGQPEYRAARKELRAQLDRWMRGSGDPRATRDDDHWDAYPYFGGTPASKAAPR